MHVPKENHHGWWVSRRPETTEDELKHVTHLYGCDEKVMMNGQGFQL